MSSLPLRAALLASLSATALAATAPHAPDDGFDGLVDAAGANETAPTLDALLETADAALVGCRCDTAEAKQQCLLRRKEAQGQLKAWKGLTIRGVHAFHGPEVGLPEDDGGALPVRLPSLPGRRELTIPEGCRFDQIACDDEDEEVTVASMVDLLWSDRVVATTKPNDRVGGPVMLDEGRLILERPRADWMLPRRTPSESEFLFQHATDIGGEVLLRFEGFRETSEPVERAGRKQGFIRALQDRLRQFAGRPAALQEATRIANKRIRCAQTIRTSSRVGVLDVKPIAVRLWMEGTGGAVEGIIHSQPPTLLPAALLRTTQAKRSRYLASARACSDGSGADCRMAGLLARSGPEGPTLMARACELGDAPACALKAGARELRAGGILFDSASGLSWREDFAPPLSRKNAESWCAQLDLEGRGWRLPTRSEINNAVFVRHDTRPGLRTEYNSLDGIWTSSEDFGSAVSCSPETGACGHADPDGDVKSRCVREGAPTFAEFKTSSETLDLGPAFSAAERDFAMYRSLAPGSSRAIARFADQARAARDKLVAAYEALAQTAEPRLKLSAQLRLALVDLELARKYRSANAAVSTKEEFPDPSGLTQSASQLESSGRVALLRAVMGARKAGLKSNVTDDAEAVLAASKSTGE